MTETADNETTPITELTKAQRRVLGVLIEKGFTTPEYYPLTLKAVTTGCNQKSNRAPLTNYSEDDVFETLDELRNLGLVAVLHTETGRTERFRHYMRHRFTFTEPQLAIVGELLLRGRQQLGELRSRASRMVAIDSLDQLREELKGLQGMNFIQSSGPLDRRGVEVDHNLYQPQEGKALSAQPEESAPASPLPRPAPSASTSVTDAAQLSELTSRIDTLEQQSEQLQYENRTLRDELASLKDELERVSSLVEQLQRDLGG